ncbi:MAG TPA: hypothetical protein VJ911_02460 [Cryomorphaceae bacterium]|nr:hypothetical protein [Cryomorphaceae bacterium]
MAEEGKSYTIHKSKKSQSDRFMDARASLRKSLESTSHRLEKVAEVDEVEFLSDTRSTDLLSTRDTFKCILKPVIWLSGTTSHERDYSLLEKYVKYKVKTIILYGGNGEDMRTKLEPFVDHFYIENGLKAAIARSIDNSSPGDAVVYSPSCAPVDEYVDFSDRGMAFKQIIQELNKG